MDTNPRRFHPPVTSEHARVANRVHSLEHEARVVDPVLFPDYSKLFLFYGSTLDLALWPSRGDEHLRVQKERNGQSIPGWPAVCSYRGAGDNDKICRSPNSYDGMSSR